MNERFLSKAKRIDNREWIQGYYINSSPASVEHSILPPRTKDSGALNKLHEIDSSTLCQCTGILDAHGKLVYENDELETEDGETGYVFWDAEELIWRLAIDNIIISCALGSFYPNEIAIVGNTHDKKLAEGE